MKNKNTIWMAGAIILFIFLAILIVYSYPNKAYKLENQIDAAISDVSIQEKRREDLYSNLVDTIKEYDVYEAGTISSIIAMRKSDSDVSTAINAVAEAYPELKSNENYKTLMTELSITENLIAQYRSNYNFQVKEYKNFVRMFPNRMFLSICGYEILEFDYVTYDTEDSVVDIFDEE